MVVEVEVAKEGVVLATGVGGGVVGGCGDGDW